MALTTLVTTALLWPFDISSAAIQAPKAPVFRELGSLPAPGFFENIAIRPSTSSLLATRLTGGPEVYIVKDPASSTPDFSLLATVPDLDVLLGIDQLIPDEEACAGEERVYVVVGGKTPTGSPFDMVVGSAALYTVTFPHLDNDEDVEVAHLSALSADTGLVNGLVAVPGGVLIADSLRSRVSFYNVTDNSFTESAYEYPEMTAPEGAAMFGINGVQIRDNHLYWSNTALSSIYRIALDDNKKEGCDVRPELVFNASSIASAVDDFNFDIYGNIYAATHFDGTIVYSDAQTGEMKVVAGGIGEWDLAGCTALEFGKGEYDQDTLYVTTNSATFGNETRGGRIVAVDF
ncbi:uncharacterized protein F5Z01DRAFT_248882 [Emericellopsis atlantica]|uniref:SMP-30/Gluconolactonase/LRE-like region domain-containing protein n=1 Tax=Emericellopsis atlantica TaxID=2614577 RepID=A0A9P7ZHZ2_9HYPO|nr:uncharacterized protein F5Z01DRAFT_248882 [Emericellopsis atlantica]KAG9252081.1 hypothetical protein F5Z01DRAFT_248882 [Emericellopsis atlantica]